MALALVDEYVFTRCSCGREAPATSSEGEALVFGEHWRETGCMFTNVLRLAVDVLPADQIPSDFWES